MIDLTHPAGIGLGVLIVLMAVISTINSFNGHGSLPPMGNRRQGDTVNTYACSWCKHKLRAEKLPKTWHSHWFVWTTYACPPCKAKHIDSEPE